MALCRQVGRWPFANPPEQATLAQILIYEAALAQLSQKAKERQAQPAAPPRQPTKRLKGKYKEDFYRMIREQARGNI